MSEILLRICDVKKYYRIAKDTIIYALKGVSFDIYKGEIFALLGVNGAGKSTISAIIATLHPPTEGDVLYQDRSIFTNVIQYRTKLGYCPQKPNFEKLLTVKENLIFAGRYFGMPFDAIEKRVNELMDQFALHQYADSTPDVLSGGYKQRLLIARSLVHSPEIIILDEPTVGMDPHIRRQLWRQIYSLKQQGVTIVLITHYFEEVDRLADRVCILDQGEVIYMDSLVNIKHAYEQKPLEDIFIDMVGKSIEQKGN